MTDDKSLVPAQSDSYDLAPRMVMTTKEALARLGEFQGFVQQVMKEGVDYGKLPGVDKPTLLKPGAEKLCEIYALTPEVEVANRVEDWQNGFFHYECRCRLINRRTGQVQAVGVGSCNSREKKYGDRWVFASELPDGVDKETLKKREGISRKTGRPYTQYLWRNEDVYTLVNTVLKMAKKRALVDATLSATRSSGMFTQDVEDWVDEVRDVRLSAPPPARVAAPVLRPQPIRKTPDVSAAGDTPEPQDEAAVRAAARADTRAKIDSLIPMAATKPELIEKWCRDHLNSSYAEASLDGLTMLHDKLVQMVEVKKSGGAKE